MHPKLPSKLLSTLFFMAVCAIPLAASAHTGVDGHAASGFFTGFFHPLTGLDHLAAMVAVGVWSALAARRAGPELLWGPLGFASLLLVGAIMGLRGVEMVAVEPMIAASLLLTGLLVLTRLRLPGLLAALLVGSFAVFHGLAHGHELAGSLSATQTLMGMLASTVLLHAGGLGLGWALRRTPVWLPRLAGGSVALLGLGLLARLA